MYGGVTNTTRCPRCVRSASAGISSDSSPMPSYPNRISLTAPHGQPPPGSCASRSGSPVDSARTCGCADDERRKMPGCWSSASSAVGATTAFISMLPDDADVQAFDREAVDALRIDFDRCEVGILRQQQQMPAMMPEAFDGDLVVEPGDDDLSVMRRLGAMHGEQVAVDDA